MIDILVQSRRDQRAAKRFFRKLLKGQGSPPSRLVTDKLRSYSAVHRSVRPPVIHNTEQYEDNRGGLPPTDAATGATDAQVQIGPLSSAIPHDTRAHSEPVPDRPAPRASTSHRMLRDRSFRVWRRATCAC